MSNGKLEDPMIRKVVSDAIEQRQDELTSAKIALENGRFEDARLLLSLVIEQLKVLRTFVHSESEKS